MANNDFDKPHFFLNSTAIPKNFTATSDRRIESKLTPAQNRLLHSKKLRGDLATISADLNSLKHNNVATSLEMEVGIQVEFESFPAIEMAIESLSHSSKKIDLLNVKTVYDGDDKVTIATVFIPEGQLVYFEKKLQDYSSNKPRDNQKLIDSIQSIRRAVFSAIWSDGKDLLPEDKDASIWWEIWLSTPNRNKPKKAGVNNFSKEIVSDFTKIANQLEIKVSPHKLLFPEHTVLQVSASQNQLSSSSLLLNRVAEIRAPKVTAEFFDVMPSEEQEEWSKELLERLNKTDYGNEPYVCIIDTGVNVEHQLLKPFTDINSQLTIIPDADPTDKNGHGTGMAGLAMWGDLTDALATNDALNISHRLESVKVLNHNGDNKDKPLGLVTADAVAEVENTESSRNRIFSMSLSANTGTEKGRASSWSSALDSLASDYLGERKYPRLFTVCAGNTYNTSLMDYPEYYTQLQDIHDPAQAWNVITVGAYTNKITLTESGDYQPLAKSGGLSPYSTTSTMWDKKNTPIKPDIVFEGGNIGRDLFGCAGMQDLSLLSTYSDFSQRYFQTINATSAATALAARFAAQVKVEYPDLWPETVRALMIHSADWTEEMYNLISADCTRENIQKNQAAKLTRLVGFGVPNLERAIKSANNSLSLVVQDELQPFCKDGSTVKTHKMNLYNLPWPKEKLRTIGEANVELTVTLSYFIEPNPSSRNILNKYGYSSHQLRFDVKRALDKQEDFPKRFNQASRSNKEDKPSPLEDPNWLLGANNRHKGSIHKDIWRGSAADLAERGQIAIYPANGWWRTRTSHERYNSKIRYALAISLSVPEVDIDIYSEVENEIKIKTTVPVEQKV
ncbi:MAG: S8 family peptidase [Oceanospirillaceae bacterium]|nr:S8 family peptidase [Oceanospirillaceae bacterium]